MTSLEPNEIENLVIESERAWKSLGKITNSSTRNEKNYAV